MPVPAAIANLEAILNYIEGFSILYPLPKMYRTDVMKKLEAEVKLLICKINSLKVATGTGTCTGTGGMGTILNDKLLWSRFDNVLEEFEFEKELMFPSAQRF